MAAPGSKRPPNRLAREKSPYLLQHAHNPVDWYPWGEEAFRRARDEQKPIFLSVGYSTCHWCHVMERESFEDPEVAAIMNEHFVNVKVDREERPDVDRVYMTFVQATTGSGGWPMSVFLTPELKPFYGGTYFPPDDRYGRPGFATLLRAIARTWVEKRDEIVRSSEHVLERLRELTAAHARPEALEPGVLDDAFQAFEQAFDRQYAGFGRAPKFPRPVTLNFLFRHFARAGAEAAAEMSVATLRMMAQGGMYDHLGGGFHRYSVDRFWHVPHFEKMLYDQAQLVASLVEGYQVTRDPFLARIAAETCDYVRRDLTCPATGAFWSAEDADSPVEHGGAERREGAFYVWTFAELQEALGEAAPAFCFHYGVRPEGNARDPHGELEGKNVLHVMHDLEDTAQEFGRTPEEMEALLADARRRLLERRAGRPRPHLDDKVLTAWNGLMIGALARASRALGRPEDLAAAERAARFFAETMWRESDGVLLRRFRDGEAAIEGYLEDYAFLAAGLIDLYEAGFDRRWLALAERLADRMNERFWDEADGGWFATTGRDPSVLVRMKEDYDGAEPSGNSIGALVMLRLAEHAGRGELARRADEAVRAFAGRLRQAPHAMPQMLVTLMALLDAPPQVVIVGERDDARTQALLQTLDGRFVRDPVVILADAATRAELAARLPWVAGMEAADGAPTAYVCKAHACARPTSDPELLAELLAAKFLRI